MNNYPIFFLLWGWTERCNKTLGVGLLRAEVCVGLCDGTREVGQADLLIPWARGKLGLPGQYVPSTWPVCNTVLWSAGVTTFLSQDLCEGESPSEYPLHPTFFLSLLLKPSHLEREKVQTISLASSPTDHTSGLVAGAQKDYSQSLELPKSPSTAEQQEWFSGSREDVSAKTAMASAAGLVLSSPSSPGHLQFRFLGANKIDRCLAMVKVVMIAQSHSSKQGQLMHRPGTAPIVSLSGWWCSLTGVISSLNGMTRQLTFSCTLGWMLFCYHIVQTSPVPRSLCISTVWLQLIGVFWLSILWDNSGQQSRWSAHRLFGSFLLQSRRSSLVKWMWPQRHVGSHQSCSVLNTK